MDRGGSRRAQLNARLRTPISDQRVSAAEIRNYRIVFSATKLALCCKIHVFCFLQRAENVIYVFCNHGICELLRCIAKNAFHVLCNQMFLSVELQIYVFCNQLLLCKIA